MKLLPSTDRFTIHTDLARVELVARLRDRLEERTMFEDSSISDKDWQGKLSGSGFEIRAIRSFATYTYVPPVFRAELGTSDNGSVIRIEARGLLAGLRVLAFWLGSIGCLVGLICVVSEARTTHVDNLTEIIMILLLLGFCFCGSAIYSAAMYWRGMRQGKQWLLTVTDGKELWKG